MRGAIKWSLCLASWLAPCLPGCAGGVGDRKYTTDTDPSVGADAGGNGGDASNAAGGSTSTAGANDSGTNSKPDAGPKSPLDACGNGQDSLVTGLRIQQVAIYQTIKIPVYDRGTWLTTRVAELVQGKGAMARVFYEVLPGWTKHPIRGVLTIDNGTTPTLITAELSPSATSVESQLNTTFNFDIDGADIGPNTKLSVALVELKCPTTLGNASDVRVPAAGSQVLGAQRIPKLRVVLVPVNLPSGPAAIPSAAQLEDMRKAMVAYYPIPDIELTLHAPMTSAYNVTPTGGWAEVLMELGRLRRTDAPASEVYYYGLVTPKATLEQYCGFGCTLGIANQAERVFPAVQVGLGGGWADVRAYDTMIHEIGHTHGLPHAPCAQGGQISGVDSSYPYMGGATNTWGYDFRDKTLHPVTDKDIMGYCSPTWISDYYYKQLAVRSTAVNRRAALQPTSDDRVWEGVILYGIGGARWGGTAKGGMEGAPIESAFALDAAGKRISEVDVVRVALSDSDDSFVYFAGREPSWDAIELSDGTLELREIGAAATP